MSKALGVFMAELEEINDKLTTYLNSTDEKLLEGIDNPSSLDLVDLFLAFVNVVEFEIIFLNFAATINSERSRPRESCWYG